jgi:DNA replication and repair protein RecF
MIANLRLQHFRSYSDAAFEFSPEVNIIVGPNASGKTNLLEAVLVLSQGASYRGRDNELIEFEQPWARLDARTSGGEERTVKLIAEPVPSKSYELGGKPYKRLSLQHTLPVVLFEPNHLQLLHGSPAQRRDYLDDLLEHTVTAYGTIRRNYQRVLAQRNALLKRGQRPTSEELFVWNLRLSEFGAHIARERAGLVDRINGQLATRYGELSGRDNGIELLYHPKFPLGAYESKMIGRLESDLQLDIARGFSGAGPHRDDFHITIDGHDAAEAASRGETRTLVLALKVIELELVEQARGSQPILLLDDVFSELDGGRRHALTDHLRVYQTFITTTDADIVSKNFTDAATIIPIG